MLSLFTQPTVHEQAEASRKGTQRAENIGCPHETLFCGYNSFLLIDPSLTLIQRICTQIFVFKERGQQIALIAVTAQKCEVLSMCPFRHSHKIVQNLKISAFYVNTRLTSHKQLIPKKCGELGTPSQ